MSPGLHKILYVEDEPDIQTIGRLALETVGGFEVVLCASGAEALDQVQQFAPDLVLLDVMMPEMDGPTTLRALQERFGAQTPPVIFITAKVQPQEIEQYKALGALDVIAKPFDPMALADLVRRIWERVP
jgi:CheY-like chemotaxis protein